MEARDFLSAMTRICSDNECNNDCPVRFYCRNSYDGNTKDDIEKVEKVVEEWLKDHPVKTRQSEFLKMYPDALMDDNGVISINPCLVDKALYTIPLCGRNCKECRKRYWLKEVE